METLEDKQQVSALLDIYGELLTERQRTFIDLHFNEDLSYGEIAEDENISRQAVHDTIQHGKKALFRFEEVLKLTQPHNSEPAAPAQESTGDKEKMLGIVDHLFQIVGDDILYDTGRVRRKLAELKEMLQ